MDFEKNIPRKSSLSQFVASRRKGSLTNTIMQLDEGEHEFLHDSSSLTPFSPNTPLSATGTFSRFNRSAQSVPAPSSSRTKHSSTPVVRISPASSASGTDPIYVRRASEDLKTNLTVTSSKLVSTPETIVANSAFEERKPKTMQKVKNMFSKLRMKRESLSLKVKIGERSQQ